jgi:hypothetical protein
MGHAGAIVPGSTGTAHAKKQALEASGCTRWIDPHRDLAARPRPPGAAVTSPTAHCPPSSPSTSASSPDRCAWTRPPPSRRYTPRSTSTAPGDTYPFGSAGPASPPPSTPLTEHREPGLGDRQAVAARPGRRRPCDRRSALVRGRRGAHARRPHPAAGPGLQRRQLELPHVRPDHRDARPGTGRQRGDRQDPDQRRRRLPHPGLRPRRPRGHPDHAGQRHGGELSEALVRSPEIGCVSFVGGRDTGARIATAVADLGKRHILEQEGLNTWGIWNYSDWDALTAVIPKLFDYGKQRCTAYPRFVVQRALLADFLAAYLPAVRSIRTGHPSPSRTRPTRCPPWTSAP